MFMELKTILAQEQYKSTPLVADFYTNLASLYSTIGKKEEAMAYYKIAAAFYEQQYGANSLHLGYAYENIAILYWDMDDHQTADDYYQKALQIYTENYGEEDIDYAITFNNIGTLYTDMKRYEEAKKYLLKSLAVIDKYMGKDNIDYLISLRNLGDLYIFMTTYEEARVVYEEALALTEQILNKTDPDYFISYTCMHNYYLKTNDYEKAEAYLLKSMAANTGLADYKEFDPASVQKYDFYSYPELISAAKGLLELWKHKAIQTERMDASALIKAIQFTDLGMISTRPILPTMPFGTILPSPSYSYTLRFNGKKNQKPYSSPPFPKASPHIVRNNIFL